MECVLARRHLHCSDVVLPPTSAEVVAVDLLLDQKTIRIVTTYVSPTGSYNTRMDRLVTNRTALDTLCQEESLIIIAGDFEFPNSQVFGDDTVEHAFLHFCLLNGLEQLVRGITKSSQARFWTSYSPRNHLSSLMLPSPRHRSSQITMLSISSWT